MNAGFWAVYKEELLFGAFWVSVLVILVFVIFPWRRKKAAKSGNAPTPLTLSFRCPDCGGSSYGSAMATLDPATRLHRSCHGNNAGDGRAGCTFSWSGHEDWKYFRCNGKKAGTPEEYEEILRKIRSTPTSGLHPHHG